MGRSRTRARAAGFYTWLKDHRDEPMTGYELVSRAPGGYTLSDTTRRALRIVAEMAAADGLCLRIPCADNGYTYMLTRAPLAIRPAAQWLGKVEAGLGRRRAMHTRVMAANVDKLPAADRAEVEAELTVQTELDAITEASRRAIAAIHALAAKATGRPPNGAAPR